MNNTPAPLGAGVSKRNLVILMPERLQKLISAAGLASRRAAEKMIADGRVTVSGKTALLGESADPERDTVCVDGKPLRFSGARTYIMLNKPRGYVTTLHDERGRPTVAELVTDAGARLYPVGRLDMYSEGLLIMTNDGDFANRLTHPSGNIGKTYHVWVGGSGIREKAELLRQPMDIDGYVTRPARVELMGEFDDGAVLAVTIFEGRNRQVRKMCDKAGLKVTKLLRVREGPLELGALKAGHWRHLTEDEIRQVMQEADGHEQRGRE